MSVFTIIRPAILVGLLLFAGLANAQITGFTLVPCNGGSSYNFNPGGSCDGSTYLWSITLPSGHTYSSTNPNLYVNWGSTSGYGAISVSATCYIGGNPYVQSDQLLVSVGGFLLSSPTLSGPSFICNNSPTTYTASTISSAAEYEFKVPSGFKINGMATTSFKSTSNSVQITAPTLGNGTAVIQVRAIAGSGGCYTNSGWRSKTITYGTQNVQIAGPNTVCQYTFVSFTANGVGLTNYSWTLPSAFTPIGGTTSNTLPVEVWGAGGVNLSVSATSCGVTVSDNIYVVVQADYHCQEGPLQIIRSGSPVDLATAEIESFPNPVTDFLTVQAVEGVELGKVELYNQLQQLVVVVEATNNRARLDIRDVDDGVYFLRIVNQTGEQYKRVLVQH